MNRWARRASTANGKSLMRQGWSDWEDMSQEIAEIRERAGFSSPMGRLVRAWKNNLYVVQCYERHTDWGLVVIAMIRSNDGVSEPRWATKQRIKNELFGPDAVAFEVFPGEEDLVDAANMYHLWVMPTGFVVPFSLAGATKTLAPSRPELRP